MPPHPEDPRQRLNIGIGGANQLFTHLQRVGSRTPLPLSHGVTYLLVAKLAASRTAPDQVFMRVYGPEEPIEREEPGSWSVVGPPFQSDLVFDWLEVHINSLTRQTIDEIRLGSTWASVTAPWGSVHVPVNPVLSPTSAPKNASHPTPSESRAGSRPGAVASRAARLARVEYTTKSSVSA